MYYNENIDEVFREFNTSYRGISNEEAQNRLKKYGLNSLKEKEENPVWKLILHQFTSPLIYILLIAAVFTVCINHYIDTAIILFIVIVNAIIGFFQEHKAEKAMQALKKLVTQKAFVVRNCKEDRIDAIKIVPGDIVTLSAGYRVSADIRLFEIKELEIDESMFTGESLPVHKQFEVINKDNVPVADQKNMAFMGTVITNGRGKGVVVRTGERTELGRISREVKATTKELSPLQKKFVDFSKKIGLVSVILAIFVVFLGLVKNISLVEIILFAISMTVAVVPEGLPIVVTVTMAVGLKRMAEKNAILRKLIAVETLGSCNYICSDKTGTITENKMTVVKVYTNGKEFEFTGVGYDPVGDILHDKQRIEQDDDLNKLLLTGLLCNSSDLYEENGEWQIKGDPTEAALIVSAMKYGIDIEEKEYKYKLVDEIPFSSKRQYMAVMYKFDNDCAVFIKGAPEKILDFSKDENKEKLSNQYIQMAEAGLRVLGFGVKHLYNVCPEDVDLEKESTSDLEFVGFQGIIDPPRQSAIDAIKSTQKAGIKVVMLTGDHKVTAKSIAGQIGIYKSGDLIMTGQELDESGENFLNRCVDKISVYARVSPHHKLKIVEALQNKGNVVAVTGDGINDAPALKKANIGVSMGKIGTDVAKEASDMVLKDDNFESIFEAVKVGRIIFDNIRKVTFFLISSGVGIALSIILSLIFNLPLPFLATQVLWVNLVTNGLQDIALAYEPGESGIEKRKPKNPRENIINSPILKRITIIGIIIAIGTLLLFWYKLEQGTDLTYARTTALNTIVFFQFFLAWNARSFRKSIFKMNPFSNPFLFVSLATALFAQISVLTFKPLQFIFHTTQLDFTTWIQTILIASVVILVVEIDKLYLRKKETLNL
ncbi:MAG: hypothetical protein A2104_09585 [Candidatus Melainabacteria bacterium GWF2_32_7]|nr:MAG: hypothetical protein A2104_09585 [Candidatus Melainabacteria bacterium GWF2_32_7]